MQKTKLQKSVPLFFNISPLPRSAVVKALLREILRETPQPLTLEEAKQLRRQKVDRKRVYLSATKDQDLIDFFFKAPFTFQYAVFKVLNQKLKEVQR